MAKDYFSMNAIDAMNNSYHVHVPPVRTARIFLDNGIGYEVDIKEISKEHISPYRPIEISISGYLNKIFGTPSIPSSEGVPYEKIIFNNPATIVIWKDGSKTVVKCQDGDLYDREKGVALCFMKKALGNKGNFNDVFKKCGALEEETQNTIAIEIANGLGDAIKHVKNTLSKIGYQKTQIEMEEMTNGTN